MIIVVWMLACLSFVSAQDDEVDFWLRSERLYEALLKRPYPGTTFDQWCRLYLESGRRFLKGSPKTGANKEM